MLEPEVGSVLRTTLDLDLGQRVREILATSMEADQAVWNGAIVLDVNTGEVLSLVGLPDYNPADPWAGEDGLDHSGIPTNFSLSIENAIEPGSTFKPFVVGWALQNGLISTTESFSDPGHFRVPGSRNVIGNADGVPLGAKTAKECIVHSSNVVAVQIGLKIGIPSFRQMMNSFGLWDPVVLGGRASPRGRAPAEKRWKNREGSCYTLPTLSFGQGLMVNPLRFAACFASLVNGGRRIDPFLVHEVGDELARSKAMRSKGKVGVEDPIRPEVSAFIINAMEAMVERRVGNPLPIIEGIRWGGKSGTARLPTNHAINTCSFVAIGPLPEPEILVLVVVKNPIRDKISGTRVAGPLAGEILREALRVRGLLPTIGPSGLESSAANSTLKQGFRELR
jgi:cell division protein FtsI/penicillin-binding protein 2